MRLLPPPSQQDTFGTEQVVMLVLRAACIAHLAAHRLQIPHVKKSRRCITCFGHPVPKPGEVICIAFQAQPRLEKDYQLGFVPLSAGPKAATMQ